MIYITGDTHIPHDIHKLSSKQFPEQKELTKADYVCGDFGGVLEEGNLPCRRIMEPHKE